MLGMLDVFFVGENMVLLCVVMVWCIGEMFVGLGGVVCVGFLLEIGVVGDGVGLRLFNLLSKGWK